MTVTPARQSTVPFLCGVFLICMCSLMLQIVQTRIISVIVYYYMAFFAVSMAMLGMTAGSLLVYFKSELFPPERVLEHLAWISSAFAISIVFSTLSLITTVVSSGISNTIVHLGRLVQVHRHSPAALCARGHGDLARADAQS